MKKKKNLKYLAIIYHTNRIKTPFSHYCERNNNNNIKNHKKTQMYSPLWCGVCSMLEEKEEEGKEEEESFRCWGSSLGGRGSRGAGVNDSTRPKQGEAGTHPLSVCRRSNAGSPQGWSDGDLLHPDWDSFRISSASHSSSFIPRLRSDWNGMIWDCSCRRRQRGFLLLSHLVRCLDMSHPIV